MGRISMKSMKEDFKYYRVIEDIKYGRIQSATEATLAILRAAVHFVNEAEDTSRIREFLRHFFFKALEARPTNALLMNVVREAILAVRKPLEVGSLDETRRVFNKYYNETIKSIRTMNDAIAKMAVNRIEDGDRIFTYSYSTIVMKALKLAKEVGKEIKIYVSESRPGLEGLNTARELGDYGIPVTLFVDSATRYFMKEVNKVFIGAEAIAANGAVVSKVGTTLVALAANEARVNVFVLAPTLKFSPETIYGELVELLEKEPESFIFVERMHKMGLKINDKFHIKVPMFDVTPPEYIDAIITEKGLIAPQAVTFMLREIYGWPFHFAPIKELLGD